MKGCLATLLAGLLSVVLSGVVMAEDKAAPSMGVAPSMEAPAVAPAPEAAAPAAEPVMSESVTLEDLAVGTGVQDRVLQGAGTSFSAAETPQITCFNKVIAKDAPTKVVHTWFLDGKQLGAVELNVGGSPWRTFSNHMVVPGAWKVVVSDMDGKEAGSVEFTVTQ